MRKFRIPVVLQDREHGFENLSQKRIRTRFAQGSHSCEIRTKILGRDREHGFLKIGTKANSHKGCVVRKLLSLGFSPLFSLVFTMTSFFKLSYLHVNTKTNLNHIRMNLRAKIKIKTCIYTRKGNKKRMNFLVFEETKFNHELSVFMLEADQGG